MEVENYPKWKEANIGGTHFHPMIMGGKVDGYKDFRCVAQISGDMIQFDYVCFYQVETTN